MFPRLDTTWLTGYLQPVEKNRGPNQFQRFQKRPAPVHKLGHFGMCITDFAKCYEFYTTYFNFHPSEVSTRCPGQARLNWQPC